MARQITIVIVNWNAGELLAACIDSILRFHADLVDAVVIVDNASRDESLRDVEALATGSVPVTILRNGRNRGFAAACNQGARLATSEYVLFLNPDTQLYGESLGIPLAFMQEAGNRSVGVVGIQLIDDHGRVTRSCSRFPTVGRLLVRALGLDRVGCCRGAGMVMKEWSHDSTRVVDQVIGAFFFVRNAIFRELDGFDERFFVYFEEVDFSARLHRLGYRSVYLANARAFHKGGGTSEQVKAHRLFYSTRSRILYAYKHWGFWARMIVLISTLLFEPFTRCAQAVILGRRADLIDTCRGFGMLYKSVPGILARRLSA